jgi:hypothetical protein
MDSRSTAKRALAVLVAFVAFPLLAATPVWLPLLLGDLGPERERIQLNAYALVRMVPALALAGVILSWLFRRWIFDSFLKAHLVGTAAGAISSVVTYATYQLPIVHSYPLFTTVPMFGTLCGALVYLLTLKLEQRTGKRPVR